MKEKQKLHRALSFLDVFCLATGAMISSGLFILPGIVYPKVGPALFVSYLLAGLLALMGVFSQGELVSAMPKSGGSYYFVTRSLGPAVGTIQGLLEWISLILKSSFALVGMVAFIHLIFPSLRHTGYGIPWIGMILASIFIGLNLIGVKHAGRTQVYLVIGLLCSLLLYIVFGVQAVRPDNLVPFMPCGMQSVFVVTALIFVSYGGLLKVASVAEEVKEAQRTIPQAMLASLIVVTVFYTFTVFVTSGVLGSEALSGSLTPISQGARVFMGRSGMIMMSLAAIMAFITTANAGIMAASRYPLALSRDKLLPECLGGVHPRSRVPHISIMLTGGCVISSLFLRLEVLVELASTVLILSYLLSHASVLILRGGRIQNYQPKFCSPFYPWTQIIGIAMFFSILFFMTWEVFFSKIVLIAAGFFIYWFYGRLRSQQEYALLHVIERLMARELVTRGLEDELKEIIRERDRIVKDRFDHIIEDCDVLDINDPIGFAELFHKASEVIGRHAGADSQQHIEEMLVRREKESSTVISDHVAIPHIVVEGQNVFNILLIRCRKGVRFSADHANIHAVFILFGSPDERNFHLRALSAIAQIVSDKQFDQAWLCAKDAYSLKDVIVLGKRRR